jgi:hypothetical protein
MLGRVGRLPAILEDLPHGVGAWVEPSNPVAVAALFEAARDEVVRRLEADRWVGPELVLVVDEWTDLPPLGPSLDMVVRHGPAVGVRLLAACTRVEAAGLERSVELFTTRLSLRT